MNSDAHPLSASLRGGESGANYEVLGKLATGGMAELFLARAPQSSGRPGPVVVLKRILPHLAEDPEFIRMFRDEAYLAATLRHPNIVQVFDIGKQGEDYFFTMEYVHGENLRAILRSAQKRGESIPLTHILTIALGITAALHHAHEQTDDQGRPLHIVHRDVSPTNVLVAYDGSVKIVDFGIAKAAAGTHVTQAGMLKGKASYMSPEQCRASTVDRRSDVFAIGILLYEMTTLTRLFKGENELAILHQVLSGAVDRPSSRRPGYPPELERIILRTLANDPNERYPTAQALQADLMAFGQQNGLRPSNPALGQFLRGLFGNKPLPWADHPAFARGNAEPAKSPPEPGPPRPSPPSRRPAAAAPRPSSPAPPRPARPSQAASKPARGPGSRRPAPKPWRPGGAKPPPPPPSVPQPASSGPTTAKQLKLGQKAHPSSRATAPRATVPKPARPSPSARPPARPARAAPTPSPPRPPSPAASYAPPPPDYDLDEEESKTAIAPQKYDAMQEAKTKVAGTTADDVAAFIAAAPAAQLETRSDEVKTQVAPKTTEDAVAAFLAAAPPADLVGDAPSPMIAKTQVAPASAEEIRALTEAANASVAAPAAGKRDLFSTPAAPTRPAGTEQQPQPGGSPTQSAPSNAPRPSIPSPSDLPPPGGQAPPRPSRPGIPDPSKLPPPGGQAAPPRPAPRDLPPPGGQQRAEPNRRDTIMNAPAQPAALGGPSRTAPPHDPLSDPDTDLDDLATVRMTVDEALHHAGLNPAPSPPVNAAQAISRPSPAQPGMPAGPNQDHPPQGQTVTMEQASPQSLGMAPGGMNPPQAPIHQWQNAPAGMEGGHTMPMPMAAEFDEEPLVVPGRNSKLIAMLVTVVVGLSLGAAGVWLFLLE